MKRVDFLGLKAIKAKHPKTSIQTGCGILLTPVLSCLSGNNLLQSVMFQTLIFSSIILILLCDSDGAAESLLLLLRREAELSQHFLTVFVGKRLIYNEECERTLLVCSQGIQKRFSVS